MKARFFAIAAMVLGMVSCAKDFAPEANYGGEVDFALAVSAPELAVTRADDTDADGRVDSHNSAYGAIDYLTGADWDGVNLRYILEVYDVADDYTNATPIKDRQVKIVDKYAPVKFELRLAPKRDYHFVVFADFVGGTVTDETPTKDAQKDLGVHHVIGATLGDITIKNDKINDECTDAYFGTLDYNPSHNTHNNNNADQKPLILKRPYSKVRVIATDLAELNLNVEPASVKVEYTAPHATAFNAVNGTISSSTSENKVLSFEGNYNELFKDVKKGGLSKHFYTADYDSKTAPSKSGVDRHTHMTLFTDYILATDEQNTIQFTMTVYDKKLEDATKQPIKTTAFNTQIPVQRNYLTTIIGNVLTTATEIEVSIDDNFASELNDENVNVKERILLETLINGGVFDLTEDLTITAPTRLKGDAVIRLNGNTLTYDIPTDKESDDNYAIMTRVENGSSLTFVGEGEVVSEGYIASVNEGGVLNISEGTFESEGCTVFQSNGGKINISGGEFKAAPYNGDHRYTINFMDSKKQEGLIEISGGRFYKYNPSESHSEVPAMDFCKNGYWGIEDGEWYEVVEKIHYNLFKDYAEVYTAEGLLKWAYIVNNGATSEIEALDGYEIDKFNKNNYGLRLMANITMPMYTVEADVVNETYTITSTPITIDADGKPSGSNWVVVAPYVSPLQPYCDTFVDGNNKSIKDLTMYSSATIAGFLGYCENVEVKNLTFERATIYSTDAYVAPLAYMLDGSYIHGVNVKNSYIRGTSYVAGIAAEAMDHYDDPDKDYVADFINGVRLKLMPLVTVSGCTTDVNTTIVGTSSIVGGIVAQGYGCMVIDCHNQADISGNGYVGGVAGFFRDYFHGQYGYIVNCTSTACTITSTGARVGGIAGYLLQGHDGPAWIVGCYSNSAISCSKNYVGSIVGHTSVINKIVGNYAISTRPVSGYGDAGNTSFSFASEADITAEKIAEMNEGIAEYNEFAATYRFPDVPVSYMPMTLPTAVQW